LADQGPAPGLNAAIRHGAACAARRLGPSPRAALVADLPALRPAELDEALAEARTSPSSAFVRDAAGNGTTLLVAGAAELLRPSFGRSSAHNHESRGARRCKWLYRACASMSTPQPISTPQPESASVPIAALSTSG
jgi:2-phospho-L-lactate guanylyltransferase